MTALQLSAAVRAKSVSCQEVMLAYLAHIKRHNPVYNAIVSMPEEDTLLSQAQEADAALARGEYRGWMHG
ncbi:MAG: amidase, partial [Pseudomonadota bacterium]|nr:amidase [Pseudomonadota bacterium]